MRYGRGANLVAMTGVPSKPPSRNIWPMILSEAPLPYISAVSKRVTPSAMLARKAFPTSLRLYSLPYPHSLVEPHVQAPTPRGATFSSSARPIVSSLCKASPLILRHGTTGPPGVSQPDEPQAEGPGADRFDDRHQVRAPRRTASVHPTDHSRRRRSAL